MKLRSSIFALFLIFPQLLNAQTSPQLNSSEIKLGIKKLNTVGSVLYIAAHPDDENTRLLAYLAKERKVRTGYLSITRGDGGQNLIGNEQGELLGLIRTQELLAARRMDGAEQFFTRAIDFGFSKNPNETFKIWGKEQILADAVWVIRNFRPDVIIARFPEDSRAGHGHHSASAIIAREAFSAAADPNRFPEQLKFVEPWQAKRIVWNTFNFGGTNTTSEDQLKVDVGVYNPLLGKGYGEIAAESRSNHRSQGFGSARQRGESLEYFSSVAGDAPKSDLFDGVDLTWKRINNSSLEKLIQKTDQDFDMEDPSKSVPALLTILTEIEQLKTSYWKTQKEKEVKELITASAGLWFESYAVEPSYAVDDSIRINSQFIKRSNIPIILKQVSALSPNIHLAKGISKTLESVIFTSKILQPYWLEEKHPIGMYTINNQQMVGIPEPSSPLNVQFVFDIKGKEVSFDRPVVYKFTDQVRGEIYQPLTIAPPVTATISEKAYIFKAKDARIIKVQLRSFRAKSTGTLIPQVPTGWKVSPQKIEFNLLKKGDEQTAEFLITPNEKLPNGYLSFKINTGGKTYNRGITVIAYDHIPVQTIFPVTEARVEQIDLKTDGKRLGYLLGAGDKVPESLKQIGYNVTILTEDQLLTNDLSNYDAIITGVRAYNVDQKLKFIQPKLMDYVKSGGTLLVQYNVNNPLVIPDIGPYPFKISRDRVTDESAKVTFLAPNNAALNYPNKITEKDFDGWVQERGLYFATDVDSRYTSVLSMNDPDDTPKNGSLIIADYGKGKFVYTSLVFFRELPAGVPGAYRLFVNLITRRH